LEGRAGGRGRPLGEVKEEAEGRGTFAQRAPRPGNKRPAGAVRRGPQKTRLAAGSSCVWQPRMDSNHRMPESESGALPLGDGAMWRIVAPGTGPGENVRLTLGELGRAAGLVQAGLLALHP